MKNIFLQKAKLIFSLFLLLSLSLVATLTTGFKVSAKTYSINNNYYGGSCSTVVVKNKVYFSVTETGTIQCYNIKSGKTTKIISTDGKGFYSMKKKGGYLYAIYDSYGGSDGSNDSIVRVNIKTGKMETLAKGSNFVIKKKTIYFTKTKRVTNKYGDSYDKEIGVYSMNLNGNNQKACNNVTLSSKSLKKIKTSKGTLISSGETYSDSYYSPKKLVFKSKNGKKKTIYNISKDKKTYSYSSIGYYTLQGNYIIYKTTIKTKNNSTDGVLVITKTNGKGKKIFYRRTSVSGW